MSLRDMFHRALTGQPANFSVNGPQDVRAMLLAIGGRSSRTKSGIDLSKAAETLGVSRRTTERWLQNADSGAGHQPSKQHRVNLAKEARKSATTKQGRARTLAQTPWLASAMRYGGRVEVSGLQGPVSYERLRTVEVPFSPEEARAMAAAYSAGGDKAMQQWMADHFDQTYVQTWNFERIDKLDFR